MKNNTKMLNAARFNAHFFMKAAFVVLSFFAVSACQSTLKQQEKDTPVTYVNAGDTLPISSVTNLAGEEVNLHNPDKKKLVILFATWCHDSNRLIKSLEESSLLADKDIEVVAISRKESRESVTAWQLKKQIKTPLVLDTNGEIYNQFTSGGIPRIITVGKDNKIISIQLAEDTDPKKQFAKILWAL